MGEMAKSRDGRIWFAGETSVQMVDPNRPPNLVLPPVHMEEVVADHRTYESLEKLAVPHLRGELEIDYAALSFKIPQRVLFRYKLEGHDENWQEVGTRRQAFYNPNLALTEWDLTGIIGEQIANICCAYGFPSAAPRFRVAP